ncbi:unnamed protein product [Acanthoscelides obtectus]|uniref:PiggyBac transposable element-derived protein 4 n=1 Tax=Acanthoscelides obtectus TaxID=200917 RepID=A0A9P0LL60_ACAOB|nr:unnamed protein product [Acanthoscelides obtectus]CAK1634021.1 PiggyBac transposable element-derived protein 4 [Acanthoscelides obtectus]
MGPKRGRFLMRQPRIKRESDPSQEPPDGSEPMASTSQYLTVPPIRIERQCSDPTPSISPSPENLLHVQEHVLVKQHSHPLLPTKSPECGNLRSSHCPMVREGPALSCNFCWNTVDNHGRILRRKTKYHCPECQTNLCIVPCFQEYHKCPRPSSSEPQSSTVVSSPTAQTSSVLQQGSPTKTFPKSS